MLFSTTIYYPSATNGKLLLSADILTLVSHNGEKWAGFKLAKSLDSIQPSIAVNRAVMKIGKCTEHLKGLAQHGIPYFVTISYLLFTRPSNVVMCGIQFYAKKP